MGHDAPVDKADQRMHDALRMHQHLDLIRGKAEIFAGLDQFQRLVEHRRRVDGNPLAHRPVRMRHRLGQRGFGDLIRRPIAEWPPGGGDDHPFDRSDVFARQGLKHRRMFAVYGQDGGTVALCLGHQQRPGGHKAFLVGQRQSRTLAQGVKAGRKASSANDGRHHPIGGPVRSLDDRGGARGGFDACPGKSIAQRGQAIVIGSDGNFGVQDAGHFGQPRDIAPPGQRGGVKRIAPALPLHQIKSGFANGPRGPEHRNAPHSISAPRWARARSSTATAQRPPIRPARQTGPSRRHGRGSGSSCP